MRDDRYEYPRQDSSDDPPQDLIEFVHVYDDGCRITKRGLDATPPIIKKFELRADEVMAFTCHQRANRALTAFHFHPDFPYRDRHGYMCAHDDGHDLAAGAVAREAARRAERRRAIERGAARLARGMATGLNTVALYFAAGGPATR